MKWLLKLTPYVRNLISENDRLLEELAFERKVTANQQKMLDALTDHRDILLSSLAASEREVSRLRQRLTRPDLGDAPKSKGGGS